MAGRQRDVVVLRLALCARAAIRLQAEREVAGDEGADREGVVDECGIVGWVAPSGDDAGGEGGG